MSDKTLSMRLEILGVNESSESLKKFITQLKSVEKYVQNIGSALSGTQKGFSTFNNDLKETNKNLDETNKKISTFSNDFKLFKSSLNDVKTSFNELNNSIKEIGSSLKTLSDRFKETTNSTNNSNSKLKEVSNNLRDVSNNANDATKNVSKLHEVMVSYFGLKVSGSILGAEKNAVKEATFYEKTESKLGLLGLNETDKKISNDYIKNAVKSNPFLTESNATDIFIDLRSVFGDIKKSGELLPGFSKAISVINANLEKPLTNSQLIDMAKAIEIRGGAKSEEAFKNITDLIVKTVTYTGGKVTPTEITQLLKYSRGELKGMSDDSLIKAISLGTQGSMTTVGTQLTNLNKLVNQGTLATNLINPWIEMGMVKEGGVDYNKKGEAKKLKQGALIGSDLFLKDFELWINEILIPKAKENLFKKTGKEATTDEALNYVQKNLGTSGQKDIVYMSVKNRSSLQKDLELTKQVIDTDKQFEEIQKNLSSQIDIFITSLKNLGKELGITLLPPLKTVITFLSNLLNEFTKFTKDNPTVGFLVMVGGLFTALGISLLSFLTLFKGFDAAMTIVRSLFSSILGPIMSFILLFVGFKTILAEVSNFINGEVVDWGNVFIGVFEVIAGGLLLSTTRFSLFVTFLRTQLISILSAFTIWASTLSTGMATLMTTLATTAGIGLAVIAGLFVGAAIIKSWVGMETSLIDITWNMIEHIIGMFQKMIGYLGKLVFNFFADTYGKLADGASVFGMDSLSSNLKKAQNTLLDRAKSSEQWGNKGLDDAGKHIVGLEKTAIAKKNMEIASSKIEEKKRIKEETKDLQKEINDALGENKLANTKIPTGGGGGGSSKGRNSDISNEFTAAMNKIQMAIDETKNGLELLNKQFDNSKLAIEEYAELFKQKLTDGYNLEKELINQEYENIQKLYNSKKISLSDYDKKKSEIDKKNQVADAKYAQDQENLDKKVFESKKKYLSEINKLKESNALAKGENTAEFKNEEIVNSYAELRKKIQAEITYAIKSQNEELRKQAENELDLLNKDIERKKIANEIADAERKSNLEQKKLTAQNNLDNAIAIKDGKTQADIAMSKWENEQKIADVLKEQIASMEKQATLTKEQQIQLIELKAKYEEITGKLDPFTEQVKGTFEKGFENLFNDLSSGKGIKNALKNFANSIVNNINSIMSKNLAESISNYLFKSSGDGLGNMFSNLISGGKSAWSFGSLGGLFPSFFGGSSSLGSSASFLTGLGSNMIDWSSGFNDYSSSLFDMDTEFLDDWGSMLSFDVGADNIPRDMIAKIHKGEMILTPQAAENVRASMSNTSNLTNNSSGGNITVNNNFAISGNATKESQDQIAAKVGLAVNRALKRNN